MTTTPIANFVKSARLALNMTQDEFAELYNCSKGNVSGWERGRHQPTFSHLSDMANRSGIPLPGIIQDTSANAQHLPDGAIRVYDSEDELDKESYVFIDVYDVKLSAGSGTAVFIVNKEDPISFRRAWFKRKGLSPETCKGLYVRGRSMEPALNDWDTVLIDTSDTEIVDGDIYALDYKGNFFIKTLYRTRDGVLLKSENPQYESIEVPDTDLKQLRILGKKVWRAG